MERRTNHVEAADSIGAPVSVPVQTQRRTLTEVLIALGEEKKFFLGIWLAGSLIVLAVVLSMPRLYSASTVVLPPQQQQNGTASALAQLGALAGVAGGAAGVKTSEEMYVAFLKTQSLQSALISKLQLKAHYQLNSLEEVRYKLGDVVQVSTDKKTGLITITADDRDPIFAAKLANAHVDELRVMLSKLAVTEAQQRRAFFEQQAAKAQDDLRAAEVKFQKEQERNGFVIVQALAESGARAQIELQTQIAAREVQLKALSRFMTLQSPDVQRLNAEIGALRQQLDAVQGGRGGNGSTEPDSRHLGAVKAYRDMRVQEASLEALVKQLEIAKLDEAKEGPLLQQVDPAMPPEFPSKPKRLFLVAAPSMFFFLLGACVAYLRWASRDRLAHASEREHWQKLRQAWF